MSRQNTPTPEPFEDVPTAPSEVSKLLAGTMSLADDGVEDFTDDVKTDPDGVGLVEMTAEPERAALAPLESVDDLPPEIAEAWAGSLGAVCDAMIAEGVHPSMALRCIGHGVAKMRERLKNRPISIGEAKK